MKRKRPTTRRRRGTSTTGVVATLATFGALGATAIMIGPRVIEANSPATTPQVVTARIPSHQRVIEAFGGLVARSRAMLAVHDRGAGSHEELVLWLENRDLPKLVDPHEIGVISHSRILQTLTLHTMPEAEIAPLDVPWQAWSRPGFCETWRTCPGTHSTVIAAGLSDVDFRSEQLIQGGPAALRITFTWAADSADGSDQASIVVGVKKMPRLEHGDAGEHQDAS